jgi:hypothetical protein
VSPLSPRYVTLLINNSWLRYQEAHKNTHGIVRCSDTGLSGSSSAWMACRLHLFHAFVVTAFLCCSLYCLFCVVLCIVCVCMCNLLLPPGGYPIAVKYIILYHISSYRIIYHIIYHIVSYISYHIYHISCHISYHISYHIIYHIISYHISYQCSQSFRMGIIVNLISN